MINEAVVQLGAAVDAVLGSAVSDLDDAGLVGLLESLEVQARRLAAVSLRLVAEVESRRVVSSTAEVLTRRLRVSPAEARARVSRAAELVARRSLTGELLPPLFPAVAQALEQGVVGPAHTEVISSAMGAVPAWVDASGVGVLERFLVHAAGLEDPGALRRTAGLMLARLAPDEPPEPDAARRDRCFGLRRHGDGTSTPTGRWNVELTALMTTALDALSAPAPSEAGLPDPRTAGQRRHDALADLTRRVLRSGTLPAAGGVPVTVLVRTTAAELTAGVGVALSDRGEPWPLPDLLAASSDAELVPVLLDDAGAVLAAADRHDHSAADDHSAGGHGSVGHGAAGRGGAWGGAVWGGAPLRLGRTRRLASRAQRLALAARDGGCTFPGCDRPAAWTEVHHVIQWQAGGPTDLDNLVLLCRHHHRNFATDGWAVRMTSGLPEWIPPPWVDPHQRPLRNHTHHPPDLHLGLGFGFGFDGRQPHHRLRDPVASGPP